MIMMVFAATLKNGLVCKIPPMILLLTEWFIILSVYLSLINENISLLKLEFDY